MDMKTIKKALMQGRIRKTSHTKQRMYKRGYTNSDLIACIMSGEKTKIQVFQRKIRVTVEGIDTDQKPIVLVIGKDDLNPNGLAIVSVMPPIKDKFRRVI